MVLEQLEVAGAMKNTTRQSPALKSRHVRRRVMRIVRIKGSSFLPFAYAKPRS
jgi:hypothetical protein